MGVSVTACGPRRDDTQKKIICERLVNECIVGGDSLPRGLRWGSSQEMRMFQPRVQE